MDNLKVVSVRMSDEELQAIDKALQPLEYYKRSDFIRAAVQVLLKAMTSSSGDNPVAQNRTVIYDALRRPFGRNTEMKVDLKIEHYDKRA